jgi:hypothetical protein
VKYPMMPGSEAMEPMVKRMNISRLYEVLKK